MWSGKTSWPSRSDLIRSTDDILHCYNRGVDKQQIFFGHEFYGLFLSLIESFHSRDELRILAYCLMPNHFHFLFRQLRAFAISVFMEKVCGEYAKTVNQVRQRVGHLFQRRYGVKWVWRDSDVPLLVNYLHQNPVKGGLVKLPQEWDYSSCREYMKIRPPGFLDLDAVLTEMNEKHDYHSYLEGSCDAESQLPSRSRFRE